MIRLVLMLVIVTVTGGGAGGVAGGGAGRGAGDVDLAAGKKPGMTRSDRASRGLATRKST